MFVQFLSLNYTLVNEIVEFPLIILVVELRVRIGAHRPPLYRLNVWHFQTLVTLLKFNIIVDCSLVDEPYLYIA